MWRNGLTIVDLDTWEQRMLSDGSQGESISGFRWASDTRFLYWTDPRKGLGKSPEPILFLLWILMVKIEQIY